MKGFIKYTGNIPRHVLKAEWTKDKTMSFEDLYEIFGGKCTATDKLDSVFVEWFVDTYNGLLANNFEVIVEQAEVVPEESSAKEELEIMLDNDPSLREELASEVAKPNKVMVESSSINVGASEVEVQQRLRAQRDSSVVGHISRETASMKTNQTAAEKIKALPKAGSVMTGDDLDRNLSKNIESKNNSSFILTPTGEAAKAIPSSKEEAEKVNAQMANMSNRMRVHLPETDGSNSKIMVGGTSTESEDQQVQPGYKQKVVEGTKNKVNKNFVGYAMEGATKEIRPEDIAKNKDEKEAIRFVNACKDTTVLKVAKIYCSNLGKQKLLEQIESRLRSLPPR